MPNAKNSESVKNHACGYSISIEVHARYQHDIVYI